MAAGKDAALWAFEDGCLWLVKDEAASPEDNARYAVEIREEVMRRHRITGETVTIHPRLRKPGDRIENAAGTAA